jgi:hypothetical protein
MPDLVLSCCACSKIILNRMALYTHVCTQSCVHCSTKLFEPHLLYHMVMANAWLKIKKNPSGLFFSGSSALSEQPKSPNPLTHAMVSTVGATCEILTQNHRRLANILLSPPPPPPLPLLPIAGVWRAFGPPHCRSIGPGGGGGPAPLAPRQLGSWGVKRVRYQTQSQ